MPTNASLADVSDLLSPYGAGVLAAAIATYWRERGYTVVAERYELPGSGGWGVRSDLVNGLPQVRKCAADEPLTATEETRT